MEQLIDRENELSILRRLARKKIGPRLLGTFKNGRFEQYFDAQTLTAKDIRNPDTSKQIAKRMRELHEGIELLEEERDAGPFIWRNWDKWVDSAGKVVNHLDRQVTARLPAGKRSRLDAWKDHGLICGVEWPVFKRTVETYRKWLNDQYGGPSKIRERLIFAHNDVSAIIDQIGRAELAGLTVNRRNMATYSDSSRVANRRSSYRPMSINNSS